jgi:hypothetical protein
LFTGRGLADQLVDRRHSIMRAGAGRDQAADDDVLLEALERVGLAVDGASVSTRVVSWNEAAEMNERVCSEALVMPSSTGVPVAGFLPSATTQRSLISSNSIGRPARPGSGRCRPDR